MVYIAPAAGNRAASEVTGEILDYTGSQLVLRTRDGTERKIDGDRVLGVETQRSEEQLRGDKLLANADYAAALTAYQQALKVEKRRWVRRQIVADMVRCCRATARIAQAGDYFFDLLQDDPQTPHFGCIPLAWVPRPLDAESEKACRAWLEQSRSPVAALLGASNLLSTSSRPAALAKLQELTASSDVRIASLARAQLWGANYATAKPDEVAQWAEQINTVPPILRAGPYLVLGRALAHHGQADEAVLALLRVPILYPAEADLAPVALVEAARTLARGGHQQDAARLCREVVDLYPKAEAAAEARLIDPSIARQTATDTTAEPPRNSPQPPITNEDSQFLAGLRERRLFDLAAKYCRAELNETELPLDRRADLVIELSQTLIEQAREAPADRRDAIWREAADVCAQFVQSQGEQLSRADVEVQQGLVRLNEAELLWQESLLTADSDAVRDRAREPLREAIATFKHALESLEKAPARTPATAPSQGARLSAGEIRALEKSTQLELARAYRIQALCYPADSADRANSLTLADAILARLVELDPADPVAIPARLEAIRCYRLRGDYETAAARLAELEALQPSPETQLVARAERLRLLIDAGRLDEATQALSAGREIEGRTSAELDYVLLETYLALAADPKAKSDAAQIRKWQELAASTVREIDRLYGPYWSRRAELLLARNVTGGTTSDVAILLRTADGLYRSGQQNDAVAVFDQASAQARSQGDPQKAFDAAMRAAAVLQEVGQYRDAGERFLALAEAYPDDERAAQAHLLGIFNAARDVERAESADAAAAHDPKRRSPSDLLVEHLRRWPDAETADRARIWLARLRLQEHRPSEALDQVLAVKLGSDNYPAAILVACEAYPAVLATQRARGESTDESARKAAEVITAAAANLPQPAEPPPQVAARTSASLPGALDVVSSPPADSGPAEVSQIERGPARREARLTAARILLDFASDGATQAEQLLAAATAEETEPPADWLARVQSLRVFALALADRYDEAQSLIAGSTDANSANSLELLRRLEQLAAGLPEETRRQLGELRLAAIDHVQKAASQESPPQGLELSRARALVDAGRAEEAKDLLAAQAAASPRDGAIQEEYASVLDRLGDPAARDRWREIEARSRRGTPRWFRAQLRLAELDAASGQSQQARQRIQSLITRYPELGGAEMKARFEQLLSDLPQ